MDENPRKRKKSNISPNSIEEESLNINNIKIKNGILTKKKKINGSKIDNSKIEVLDNYYIYNVPIKIK